MNSGQTKIDEPLNDAEWDRLEAILHALGERAEVDLEGLDGLIAAFACGPRSLMPSRILPLAFKGGEIPEFASEADAQEFFSLAFRRGNEYSRFFGLEKDRITVDNLVLPTIFNVSEAEAALAREWTPPAGADTAIHRPGRWPGQAWARGFMRVLREYDALWKPLDEAEDGEPTLTPLLMLDLGFNPDRLELPFDPEQWVALLPLMARDIDAIFRADFLRSTHARTPFRATPKIGRNDPCPCGSGRKYKRCCGTAT